MLKQVFLGNCNTVKIPLYKGCFLPDNVKWQYLILVYQLRLTTVPDQKSSLSPY